METIDWTRPLRAFNTATRAIVPAELDVAASLIEGPGRVVTLRFDEHYGPAMSFRDDGSPVVRSEWRLQNAPAGQRPSAAAPVDWSRPVEVVLPTRPGMPPAPADVQRANEDGSAQVCFGPGAPGQRAYCIMFEPDGTPTPVLVRNAAPAFDPSRPFRTADGRAASLVARIDPPLHDKALVVRVLSGMRASEHIGFYQADGRPSHGYGMAGGGDELVNVDARPPSTWDPNRPTRTRSGFAVRHLEQIEGGRYACDALEPNGHWVRSIHRADGTWAGADGPVGADLVNFDPAAEAGRPATAGA